MGKLIVVTAQQRANALEALNVMWPSVPPQNVYPELLGWRIDPWKRSTRPNCRTLACFGGWCAWWPAFREQGVRARPVGTPYLVDDEFSSGADVSLQLFGVGDLFRSRTEGGGLSDHEVVTQRLGNLIANSRVHP